MKSGNSITMHVYRARTIQITSILLSWLLSGSDPVAIAASASTTSVAAAPASASPSVPTAPVVTLEKFCAVDANLGALVCEAFREKLCPSDSTTEQCNLVGGQPGRRGGGRAN